MSGTQIRLSSAKQKRKKTRCDNSAMNAKVMQELKSMRSELCRQMTKLSNRLSKIECVISKIDKIDKIITKVLQIEDSVTKMKELLNSMDTRVSELVNKTRFGTTSLEEQPRSLCKNYEFRAILP